MHVSIIDFRALEQEIVALVCPEALIIVIQLTLLHYYSRYLLI